MVYRVFVEKKDGLRVEADGVFYELKNLLKIKGNQNNTSAKPQPNTETGRAKPAQENLQTEDRPIVQNNSLNSTDESSGSEKVLVLLGIILVITCIVFFYINYLVSLFVCVS